MHGITKLNKNKYKKKTENRNKRETADGNTKQEMTMFRITSCSGNEDRCTKNDTRPGNNRRQIIE